MNRTHLLLMASLGGASIIASIPAAIVIRQSELNAVERDFRTEVDRFTSAINRELQLHFSPLEGLNVLFTGSETVTPQEFQRVARRYLAKHPNIQALQWVPYIPQAQRQRFEAQLRAEYPNFQIKQRWQQNPMPPATARQAYFPVALVEPDRGNEAVLGFDLGSDPQQRQTLEQARDSGKNRVTENAPSMPDQPGQKGFLAVSPVYRGHPRTPQERQAQLLGFVVGVYRVKDILNPIFTNAKKSGIGLTILDETDQRQPKILAALSRSATQATSDLSDRTPLSVVKGRSWVVVVEATPDYVHRNSSWLFVLLPFLGVVVLWSGGILLFMKQQRLDPLEQEQYFQAMANQSPALMWMTETDQSFSFFNQTWLTFTGKTLPAERGTQWMTGIHPEDRQNWQQIYDASFNQRDPFTVEHRLRQANGHYAWMLSVGKPRYNANGEFSGYIGTSIDISRLKQADVQCQLVNQELLRSNQDLEQMAAVLSHDMREPLRKIQAFTELIQGDYLSDLDEKGQRYFSYVIDAAARMQAMIDAVLAYARLESGEQEIALTDLNQMMEQVQQDLSLPIQDNDAVVEVGQLPAVMINAVDIRQVFQNLLTNALKFRGAATPVIQIASSQQQDFWLISVRDNGIGIASEHLDRIFVMLKRLHNRTAYEGSGIGLAICKKIIERYGGSIWAESEVGKGTTFYIKLPIHLQDDRATDVPFVSVFDF